MEGPDYYYYLSVSECYKVDGISDTDEFVKEAGTMAQNVYYSFAAPDADKLPSAKAFVQAYKARFNSDVGPYSAPAFGSTYSLIAMVCGSRLAILLAPNSTKNGMPWELIIRP